MQRKLLITSILALGLGIAQAQTQGAPQPMQGGSEQGTPGTAPQDSRPSTTGTDAPAAQGTADNVAPQIFKGCVNGSTGSWTLVSDKDGKTMPLSGTDDQLSQFKGQQVRISGTETDEGKVTVASIEKISDNCTNQGSAAQSSSNMSAQPSSTDQSSAGTQGGEPGAAAPGSTSATGAATQGQTTPPVSGQTPASGVGTGAASSPGSATGQGTPPSAPQSSQSAEGSQGAATSSQLPAEQKAPRHISDLDMGQNATAGAGQKKLPQTASPLPLLGLLGVGSLVGGLTARRKN